MRKKEIQVWADSFHEGNWCCEKIGEILQEQKISMDIRYKYGFQPIYSFVINNIQIEMSVYGGYTSCWKDIPQKVKDLLSWGKPDIILYNVEKDNIIFAIEETAAVPTGNQSLQRCERMYGSAKNKIPFCYLVSEYGLHIDQGVRRNSIWPSLLALKSTYTFNTPCLVLLYSSKQQHEDYSAGLGVNSLFNILYMYIIKEFTEDESTLNNLYNKIYEIMCQQYHLMMLFIENQWRNIVDYLPGHEHLTDKNLAKTFSKIALNIELNTNEKIPDNFLKWPSFNNLPADVQSNITQKSLIKYDPLCALLERDVSLHKSYTLSNNAGSGKPTSKSELIKNINVQQKIFDSHSNSIKPSASFNININDFPSTDKGNVHVTTSKNTIYIYNNWKDLRDTIIKAYPRLSNKLNNGVDNQKAIIYISNSIKKGRIFGDPFTGQLTAYSIIFGKLDKEPTIVIGYFPHQSHGVCNLNKTQRNKGQHIMEDLTDYLIFTSGIGVNLKNKKIY